MAAAPVLSSEPALRVGQLVHEAGYELDVTPRRGGADLAASRDGAVWATFHLDLEAGEPARLRVGATVWGGARTGAGVHNPLDAPLDPRAVAFVRDRLALACAKGREQNPDHCRDCPVPGHR